MGIIILFITLLILLVSYRLYVSRQVNENIHPTWKASTPARRFMDGINFFPTNPGILTGFQFKSISLDVIISPIIALQFGWLPAILWLIVGTIFFGWVQDYLVTIMSIRNQGQSVARLFETHLTSKSYFAILIFLLAYLVILISQLGLLTATILSRPDLPISLIFLAISALIGGILLFRTKIHPTITTAISILIAIIGIGSSSLSIVQDKITQFNQWIVKIDLFGIGQENIPSQTFVWLLFIFIVCYLIGMIPSWRFAVPFNYISAWMLILATGLAVTGLILGTIQGKIGFALEIPPITRFNHTSIGPIWPILFVSLASGAVSGWHTLVSTFSTSHQLEKEPLAKPVITGAKFGQTMLVAALIVLAAAFGVSSGTFNITQSFSLSSGPATAFAFGLAKTWNVLGFPESVGSAYSAYLYAVMGVAILHLAVRYSGMIVSELLAGRSKLFRKSGGYTLVCLALALLVIMMGMRESIWVLFPGANQLLASLALLLSAVWLKKGQRNYQWALWPAILLFFTGNAAMIYTGIYLSIVRQLPFENILYWDQTIGNLITVMISLFFIATASYIFYVGMNRLYHPLSQTQQIS